MKLSLIALLVIASQLLSSPAVARENALSLQRFLDESVEKGAIAGGVALLQKDGEMLFAHAFGYADVEAQKPFQLDTPVVVASISKPMLATVAFRLQDKQLLQLSDRVSQWITAFEPVDRGMLVQQLITHTSGLPADRSLSARPWLSEWTAGLSLAQVVAAYPHRHPPGAGAGTRFAYSGLGTDVLARCLEVASSKNRNALLKRELSSPLGLRATGYRSRENAITSRLATAYEKGANGSLIVRRARRLVPDAEYSSSGGGVISTAPDLVIWLQALLGWRDEEFLSPEARATFFSKAQRSKTTMGGMFVRDVDRDGRPQIVGHTGSSGGDCWIDLQHGVIGVFLTQTKRQDIEPEQKRVYELMRAVSR